MRIRRLPRGLVAARRGARHPARGLRLRDPRRRQRHPADRRHRPAGVPGGSPPAVRGLHAGRQLVELSTAQARHRQSAAGGGPRRGVLLPLSRPRRLRIPARGQPAARRDRAGHARRRRGGARGLSPVCYSAWIRCVLPERARGQSPLDGGERRPGARQIPAALAAARPAAADGSAARGQRECTVIENISGGQFMKRMSHGLMLMVAVFLLHVPLAFAQVDRATITGVVKDSTGGVVPGATVTVTNLATNLETHQQTTETGSYQVVNLNPGRYRIDAELSGFKKFSQVITLEVGQRARLDVELQIGLVAETIIVAESSQLVNTNDATLGAVIPQMQVANLPLAIRNWDDLLALVPGVQGDRYTEQGGGTSFGRTGGINVHGARALQNNFLLDGVDNNSISENVQELTSQVSRPSVDAIQEFKVVTSPYSAEYGRSPGAAVSVSTKSGTNAIHGTAYEYYRNDALDANDFFSNRAHSPKPPNDQNQFGGNVGGPLIENKAFFFGDYEGTRITRGVTRITSVPTADQRAGIFTTPIKDPPTGLPFTNNMIPANRIDPYAASIIALVPLPNQPGANNFFRTADLTDNSDRFIGRGDWKPGASDSVFGRYIYSNRKRDIPGAFGGVVDGTGTSAFGNQTIKTNAFVGGWTRVISSTMVNEARISWSQATSDAVQQPYGLFPPAAATIPGSVTDPIVAGGLQGISI